MSMTVFKGDEVKLDTGQTGIIIDTWGVARDWCKLRTGDGTIIYAKADRIESIITSFVDKRRKRR